MKNNSTQPIPIKLGLEASALVQVWKPRTLAQLNNHEVKIARFKNEFVWHKHSDADELFLVIEGSFEMMLHDQTLMLKEGEMVVIPKGVLHCPVSKNGATVLLIEPKGLVKTGD
jgi:mannose-6-phosphate isomerase-like protein (cupin superfamily)